MRSGPAHNYLHPPPRITYCLQHKILACGYSVQVCPLYCGFALPTEFCVGNDFCLHYLYEHCEFYGQKAVARSQTPSAGLGVFAGTDLEPPRMLQLQADIIDICRGTQPKQHLKDCYGFIEVKCVPDEKVHFCCSRCFFTADKLALVKEHLVWQHVEGVLAVVPPDYLDSAGPWIRSPRKFPLR